MINRSKKMKLHLFQKTKNCVDLNPYGMKVDTFMKLNKLSYAVVYDLSSENAPRHELPFIEDGNNIIDDSSRILEYLSKKFSITMDDDLDPAEQALSLCVKRLLEDHTYPIILYSRMIDPKCSVTFKSYLKKDSATYNEEILNKAMPKIIKKLHYCGLGNLSKDEVYALGIENLKTVSQLLGDKTYFLGDKLHTIDTVIYAFLENIQQVPLKSALNDYLEQDKRLTAYCSRISMIDLNPLI